MKTENHMATIPMADYDELINAAKSADKKISDNKSYIEELRIKGREFVSALAFLEEKGLLDEFNAKIQKSYKLQSVGINKVYKQLMNP